MIEIIDATRLRSSLQCLRMCYWEHERNISLLKPKLALAYGIAVHACLESHYHGQSAGQSLARFEEVWDREVGEQEEEDPKRNPRRWAETFLLYRQRYREEPFQLLTLANGHPAVEVPFFLPLTDDLALAGIIDLIIKYLGQIMVVDHKTTSYLNSKWTRSFDPNHQFSAYLLAANELLHPPETITTLLVNAIKTDKSDMGPEALFDRIPTTRSLAQLALFKEELVGWWSVVRACRQSGHWPRNDDRCERWPEGCAYKSLCTDIDADYRKLVPSPAKFREKVWDPLKKLREKGLNVRED